MCQLILERLRYTGSGLRVPPSYFSIFADVSIFTRNFYPFSRGKPRPDLGRGGAHLPRDDFAPLLKFSAPPLRTFAPPLIILLTK